MKIPFCILFLFCFLFFSCQDNCDFYRTYTAYDPIYSKIEDIRDSVSFESKRDINNPGKLNYKGGYLFITETGKGIHVIDNRNIILLSSNSQTPNSFYIKLEHTCSISNISLIRNSTINNNNSNILEELIIVFSINGIKLQNNTLRTSTNEIQKNN